MGIPCNTDNSFGGGLGFIRGSLFGNIMFLLLEEADIFLVLIHATKLSP